MKILQVCPFTDRRYGGMARIVNLLCQGQDDMTLLTKPYMTRMRKLFWLYLRWNPLRELSIEDSILKHNPDIVHVHHISCLKGALATKIPVVFSMHDAYEKSELLLQCRRVFIPSLNIAEPIAYRSTYKNIKGVNYRHIPHPVSLPLYERKPENFTMFVGRATKAKGLDEVLREAEANPQERFMLHLLPGPMLNDYRMYRSNVSVYLDSSDDTLAYHYARARKVIIASRTKEAFCLVAAEAHRAGCPIEFRGTVTEVPEYWRGSIDEWRGAYRSTYENIMQ